MPTPSRTKALLSRPSRRGYASTCSTVLLSVYFLQIHYCSNTGLDLRPRSPAISTIDVYLSFRYSYKVGITKFKTTKDTIIFTVSLFHSKMFKYKFQNDIRFIRIRTPGFITKLKYTAISGYEFYIIFQIGQFI